jgi:hypothetical protein
VTQPYRFLQLRLSAHYPHVQKCGGKAATSSRALLRNERLREEKVRRGQRDGQRVTSNGQFESSGAGGGQCVLTSTGTYTVTGGTGSFANATGSGIITTVSDLCAGIAAGTYTGTISQPNSH